jgi:hypothetical protein
MRLERWILRGLAVATGCWGALVGGVNLASAAPTLDLSRTAVNFGFVPGGTRIPQAVVVTNTGDAPLNISTVSITGANAGDFVLGGTCGAPIVLAAGGGRCRLEISSALTSGAGTRRATVALNSNASPAESDIGLTAFYAFEITHGILTTPAWLDFGAQAVGTAAPLQSVTISSTETIVQTLDSVVLVGGNSADFTLSSDCVPGSRFLNGSTTCTTTVGFTPTAAGPRSTELEFDFHGSGGVGDRLTYRYSITGVGGTGSPAPIDLNQYGLSGSWYDAATSGQGMELEFFVSAVASDTAYLQGAWFTFDAAAGGVDRQRWYTYAGSATTGNTLIPVTIYQNTGGNFNAPPATSAVAVGSGTLSFSDCTTASFNYVFNDGSGRNGSIPLTRLTQNVTCGTVAKPADPDFGFSGNWFDPATSGQGFVMEVNPVSRVLFVTWYTYASAGTGAGAAGQRWYTAQAAFVPGMRSVPTTLYETTGGAFNAADPKPSTSSVGTATVRFASCTSASIDYNFASGGNAGRSGTIQLARVGPAPVGCGP